MISLEQIFSEGWSVPDRRPMYEWARDKIDLPRSSYRIPGPFDVDRSRYMRFPMELLVNDEVRQLNALKAVQSAGSLIADVFFPWILDNAPGPTMWNFQTDDDADVHWNARIVPTFKNGPLRKIYEQARKTKDFHQFGPLDLYIHGANMSNLQGRSIKYLINDEVWLWEKKKPGLLGEALARTEAFKFICKIFNISQAGDVEDEWDNEWQAGKRFDWSVRCKKCDFLHPFDFFARRHHDRKQYAGVVYDRKKRADGSRDSDLARDTARYVCPRCGHEHEDNANTWDYFNNVGEYVTRDPAKGMRNVSTRWTALVSGGYGELAEEYVKALDARDTGTVEKLKKFHQKKAVIPWEEFLGEPIAEITTGSFAKGAEWEDEEIRFMTMDYQEGSGDEGEHWWYDIRAWSRCGSRLIDEGRAWTAGELRDKQLAHKVRDVCCMMDGADLPRYLAGICIRYGWSLLVGSDHDDFTHHLPSSPNVKLPYSEPTGVDPRKGQTGQKQRYVRRWLWSNPTVKDILWRLRHGKGMPWEVPSDVSAEYLEQIDSEKRKAYFDKNTGQKKFRWVKFKKDNHHWDCECMQVVCALMHKILVYDDESEANEREEQRAAASLRDRQRAEAAKAKRKPAPYATEDQMSLAFTES